MLNRNGPHRHIISLMLACYHTIENFWNKSCKIHQLLIKNDTPWEHLWAMKCNANMRTLNNWSRRKNVSIAAYNTCILTKNMSTLSIVVKLKRTVVDAEFENTMNKAHKNNILIQNKKFERRLESLSQKLVVLFRGYVVVGLWGFWG